MKNECFENLYKRKNFIVHYAQWMSALSNLLLIILNKWAHWVFCVICAHFAQLINTFKLIVFSISDQKSRLDSIFLTRLDHKLIVLSLVLHNFMKSISKSISWRNRTISLNTLSISCLDAFVLNVLDTRAIYELLYI